MALPEKDELIRILDAAMERTADKPDMDDWSWGDFILSHAAAILALLLGVSAPGVDVRKQALGVILNPDTAERMLRLSEILTNTEGFESMRIVQRNEAPDGAITDAAEKAEVDGTFRRLLNLDS